MLGAVTQPAKKDREDRPETLAEQQLSNARHDPRLDTGPEAVIADWRTGLEAAERTRTVAILGISGLAVAHDSESPVERALWEQGELARAEVGNEFAELNAQALVAMMSALDALVESLVPRAQEMLITFTVDEGMKRAAAKVPEAHSQLAGETLDKIKEAASEVLRDSLGRVDRAVGASAKRWSEYFAHRA
jgi:hypothetical protein